MKELRTEYNRQSKKEGKLNVTLYIMAVVTMLICGCSNNNKTVSTSNLETNSDSITHDLQSTVTEFADASVTVQSIFDKLANDMVYVEKDLGSFYICKYEVTQKLWKEVMGKNPSQMQGDDLPVEQVNWNECQISIEEGFGEHRTD